MRRQFISSYTHREKGDLVMAEPDASSTVKGITKLSLDPVSATSPIAVGDNDARVNEYNAAAYASFSDAVDAVAGVSGTNKLVISTPITVSSGKTVPADVILVFVSAGMLTITSGTVTIQGEIRAKADKIFNISGGAVNISAATFDECYFEWYGITSGSDNTTAIQSLITARKSSRSTRIRMLPGIVYSFASQISLSESLGIELVGGGGSDYDPQSELRYTGSGSSSAIAFRSVNGFVAESVKFSYNSASFTGYLIDCDWSDSPGDSIFNRFRRCQFTGIESVAYGARALISANKGIIWTIEQCIFGNAQVGIAGARDGLNATISAVSTTFDTLTVTAHGLITGDRINFTTTGSLPSPLSAATGYNAIVIDANTIKVATSRANAEAGTAVNLTTTGSGTNKVVAGGYSYVIKLDSNMFINVGLAIYNPDQCWTIINNAFEPTRDSMSGGVLAGELRVINGQAGRYSWNMVFSGNWMGDVSSTANDYSVVHLQGALGAVISGNLFYGAAGTSTHNINAIEMSACQGVTIQANRIEGWDRAFIYTNVDNYSVSYISNDLWCADNTPRTVSSFVITETRLANSNLPQRISGSIEIAGSAGDDALPNTYTLVLGKVEGASISTGQACGIRVTSSAADYPDGSLVIQPRTVDVAAEVGFVTASGERLRIVDSGLKIGGGSVIGKVLRGTVSVNPSSVAANSVSTQTVTITGAATGDSVVLNPPAAGLTAGLLVPQVRVSAADTVSVTYYNTTGSAIDEGSGSWNYLLVR